MIRVVNVIPKFLSDETYQDSEPNIAVNPAHPNEIAITTLTPDPLGSESTAVFISTDFGAHWDMEPMVPGKTSDITPRFASEGNRFYVGNLQGRPTGGAPEHILDVWLSGGINPPDEMTILTMSAHAVDQPYTQAITVQDGPEAGRDRVYIGLSDPRPTGSRNAAVLKCMNANEGSPVFNTAWLESRASIGQGPQVRTAAHSDGTVFAVYYGYRASEVLGGSIRVITDVVVVRDDAWAAGPTPFTALEDPNDGLAGVRVVTDAYFLPIHMRPHLVRNVSEVISR